jgi:hypothetical protein
LRVLVWRDMLAVGTLINVLAGLVALILLSRDVPAAWAIALHFAPLPYNAFLLLSLSRARARTPLAMGIGIAWFFAMIVI